MKPILTTAEAADLLRCEPETVEAAARSRRLRGVKFGREWVFPLDLLVQDVTLQADAGERPTPEPQPAAFAAHAGFMGGGAAVTGAGRGRRARPRPDLAGLLQAASARQPGG